VRWRSRHPVPPAERPADDEREDAGLVETVDIALASLRGRPALRGSAATAMFELLSGVLPEPAAAPTSNILVERSLDAFREATIVPTTALADRLLDLRIAAQADAAIESNRGRASGAAFLVT
jgi:hypothetical protein